MPTTKAPALPWQWQLCITHRKLVMMACLHVFSWEKNRPCSCPERPRPPCCYRKKPPGSMNPIWIQWFPSYHIHHSPSDRPHLNISSLGSILTQQQMWSKVGWRMAFLQFLSSIRSTPIPQATIYILWSPGRGQCSPHHKRNLHLEYYRVSDCSKPNKNQESLQSRWFCKVGVNYS